MCTWGLRVQECVAEAVEGLLSITLIMRSFLVIILYNVVVSTLTTVLDL